MRSSKVHAPSAYADAVESTRDRLQVGAGALLVLAVALILFRGAHCGHAVERPKPAAFRLAGKTVTFSVHADGSVLAEANDGSRAVSAELVFKDDEGTTELDVTGSHLDDGGAVATASLANATHHVDVELSVDPHTDALTLKGTGIGLSLPLAKRSAFLEGRGELGDFGSDHGPAVFVEGEGGPFALAAPAADLAVVVSNKGGLELAAATEAGDTLVFAFAVKHAEVLDLVNALRNRSTKMVRGSVTGATGVAHVIGLDENGGPRVRIPTDPTGHFALSVPDDVTEWYASEGTTRTSAPVHFPPGTGYDLVLDVSDGGELAVRIEDGDTHAPITARLVVHGVEGTLDPSFGPDYRASGAGPLIDALRGDVVTPLPAGKYRVLATKGMEWTVDSVVVDVKPGERVPVLLAPRHAIASDGLVGCDLHVHARPSFDTPVSTEDRVLSLVAAGVDFAVPTEHNIVGDYGPSLDTLGLTPELAFVSGVEITTYSPRFGHFGLFPYPLKSAVPPYRATSPDKLFAAVRASDPDKKRILQVNHPRLPKDIGFFNVQGYKHGGPIPIGMRKDFDALEVYNGYDIAVPSRVDDVLGDWFALLQAGHRYVATGSSDSHRIQYQWAGYPRTVVSAPDAKPIDALAVVASLKAGHAFVTSGPFVDFRIDGHGPGDTVTVTGATVTGHVTVRAVPWIDVSSIDVVVGGSVVTTLPVTASTDDEATTPKDPLPAVQAKTIRFDADVPIPVAKLPSFVVVIVRGTRLLDDILPFMPVPPRAFTNPIWLGK